VPDPHGIDVWMRWEFEKLNAGVVTRSKSLRVLLEDPAATLETRDGGAYHIEREVLVRIADACSPAERERLRLPVTIHFSADVSDAAFILDEVAAEVLRRLEGWGAAYPHRDGRTWLPHSLAVDLVLRYGGALQQLLL